MKHFILSVALGLGFAGMAAADPVFGVYKTIADDNGNTGHIKVAACGSRICGKLIKSIGPDGKETASDNVGKNIIWDMVANGDGHYSDGKVWDPSRDKTYKSKMQLTGKNLAISGCILLICRNGGTWTRIN